MKRPLLLIAVFLVMISGVNAQITITGDITANTTWTNNNTYLLTGGFVYVTNNATLTIQPGTLIKGNGAALVITRGAKIIADGTPSQPIVFTSYQPAGQRNPGDWGGLLVLGNATINDPAGERLAEGGIDPVKGLYGGSNDLDSSGVIRYVRIEYAGIAFQPNNETNGLTLGAVGSKTLIDYVQVSYGGDDAFEFFGGTVNAKHLIANKTVDDMFDSDYGFRGKLQFLIGVSDSTIADISKSNGFESDNDASGSTNTPMSKPVFSNVTIIGPKITSTTNINSNFGRAAHLKKTTSLCSYNSVYTGFPTGLKIEGTGTSSNVSSGSVEWKNNIIAGCTTPLDSSAMAFNMMNWFNAGSNSILPNSTDIMLSNPYSYASPVFMPQTGSPLLSGADFTSGNLNDPFFTSVSFRGAMGTSDWTSCWSEFDPDNQQYLSGPVNNGPTAAGSAGTPSGTSVNFTNTSTNATFYSWDFGDGNTSTQTSPSHNYSSAGNFTVTLIAFNGSCSDTTTFQVSITVGTNEITNGFSKIETIPNPAKDNVKIRFDYKYQSTIIINICDLSGKKVATLEAAENAPGEREISVNLTELENGIYFVQLIGENGTGTVKLIVAK